MGLREAVGGAPWEKDGKVEGVYPWGRQWPPPQGAGNYAGETTKRGMAFIEGYEDPYPERAPVGSFKPNRFGLYDLGGNVREWCEDWYSDKHEYRVVRGGSYDDFQRSFLISSSRENVAPGRGDTMHGFRVLLAFAADGETEISP